MNTPSYDQVFSWFRQQVIFGKQFSEYWEAREECILEMIEIYKEEFL